MARRLFTRKQAFAIGLGASALLPSKILAGGACAAVAYGAVQLAPRLSLRTPWQEASPSGVSASAASHSPQKRVRLLSQNVWNSFFAGGPGRIARLKALGEYLEQHDFDIVATQEMFVFGLGPVVDSSEAKAASDIMKRLGFEFQTSYLASAPVAGQSSGLVVYSKLPIVREEHHTFSSRRSVSCKGYLEVELELPAPPYRLVLLNTHLEHAHSEGWRHVRKQQWSELVERTRDVLQSATLPSPMSFVTVLGDFNVCGDEFGKALDNNVEYSHLTQAMSEVGLGTDLVSSPSLPTMRKDASHRGLRCSVDHAFVNRAMRDCVTKADAVDTRGTDGLAVSDHHGISIDLSL